MGVSQEALDKLEKKILSSSQLKKIFFNLH